VRKLWLFALVAGPLLAQQPGPEFFEKKVRPILAGKCSACHGAKMQMAGLNLSSPESAANVIVKGDPEASRLFQAVAYTRQIKMPPTGKLGAEEIASIKEWIAMGAPWPSAGPSLPAAPPGSPITSADRSHWAFQPVKKYAPPKVANAAWVANEVDRFILARLEEKGLTPAPPAPKLTLLRRVTYDLTGLPPTPREIDGFLADSSPDAYKKVVDRLLASPQYGERWGRHWLDVARYADSTGMDEDHIYPHAWRYRDYVVQAFNNDLPYDRFIVEQIAGDLLPDPKPVATGFLALGPKPLAQQDRVQMIYDVVDEQIDTVSKTFMGLTIACARCHDHKFDPIRATDYYGLAAIFASTMNFRNLGRPGSVSYIYYAPLDAAAFGRYQTHRWRMYGKQNEMEEALGEDMTRENALLRPRIADFLTAAWEVRVHGDSLDAAADRHGLDKRALERWLSWLGRLDPKDAGNWLKEWREAGPDTIASVAAKDSASYQETAAKWDSRLESWRKRFSTDALQDRDVPARPVFDAADDRFFAAATFNGGPMDLPDSARVAALRREWKELHDTLPPEPPMASAVCEGTPVDQRVFLRGDHHNQGEPVARHVPVVLAADQPVMHTVSGRLELARWLASPDHPLTARVMVNRIWQGHFGEALVRTPNNWGRTGEKPAQPELLDFLAARFVEGGWSVKALHRLILLSSTYRMSASVSPAARELDPGNRLWSHANRVRMSVEQIRDSLLALDGALDLGLGGSLLPSGEGKRKKLDPDDLKRRTLYIPVRRGSIPTVLATFDYGDATTPGDGRPRTNVAPQALFLMNSRFVLERAQGFARRLLADASLTDAKRIEQAYLMVLTRRAEPPEVDAALSYIETMEKRLHVAEPHLTAWQSFCHALMSSNEFVYLE
jgi:hypothetical protein